MVNVVLHLNRSFTDGYYPLFECIYSFEIFNVFIYIFVFFPYAVMVLWNARPFHRNLRVLMCNLCIAGVFGLTARLVVIYHQYFVDGGYVVRVAMLSLFMNVFFFIALDRTIATIAWSWYEEQTISTLLTSFVLESCAFSMATGFASALVFSFVTVEQLLACLLTMATVGLTFLLSILAANKRIEILLGKGILTTRYSISRAYQIKENINVIKAILRLALLLAALNVPIFILEVAFRLFSSADHATSGKFAYASMDLFISIYPMVLVSYIPFSDPVFERSLKRLWGGQVIFKALTPLYRCRPPLRRATPIDPTRSEADVYFHVFNLTMNGQIHGSRKPARGRP